MNAIARMNRWLDSQPAPRGLIVPVRMTTMVEGDECFGSADQATTSGNTHFLATPEPLPTGDGLYAFLTSRGNGGSRRARRRPRR